MSSTSTCLGTSVSRGLLQRLIQRHAVLADALQQRHQRRNMHALVEGNHALVILRQQLGVVALHEGLEEGEVIADDAELGSVHLDDHFVHAGVLDGLGLLAGDGLALGSQNLARVGMHHVLHRHAG